MKTKNKILSTLFVASRYEFPRYEFLYPQFWRAFATRAWLQRTFFTIILAQVFNLCLLSQDNDPQPWQNGWFPTGAKQIHDSAFFSKGININGIQIDSVYAANDTLYFVNDSGIFKAILNPGSGGGAGFTQEEIEDFTGAMVTGNTETLITVTYDDGAAKLNFVVDNDLSNYDNTTSAFITDYTVTEGDVTTHQAAISITESQISDFQSYALNSTALENTTAPYTDADSTKLDGIETGATADQTDSEIETAYNNQVSIVSQGDAETGTSTTVYRWTPQRVAQAIAALGGGGGGGTDDTLALFISNQEVIDSLEIDENFTDNIYNEVNWSIDSGIMYINNDYFFINDTTDIRRIAVALADSIVCMDENCDSALVYLQGNDGIKIGGTSSGGIGSESDPVFTAHLANDITGDDTTRWGQNADFNFGQNNLIPYSAFGVDYNYSSSLQFASNVLQTPSLSLDGGTDVLTDFHKIVDTLYFVGSSDDTTKAYPKNFDPTDKYNNVTKAQLADSLHNQFDSIVGLEKFESDTASTNAIILNAADTINDISINNQRLEFQVNQSTFTIDNTVYDTSITLDATDINNLGATPVEVLPAPGAGNMYDILSIAMYYNYNSITFTNDSPPTDGLEIDCGFKKYRELGTLLLSSGDRYYHMIPATSPADGTYVNQPIDITYDGDYGTGDGTLTLYFTYKIITL